MMRHHWYALMGLALVAGEARADEENDYDYTQQCRVLSLDQANRAQHVLSSAPMTVRFCEPCGDRAPSEPARATPAIAKATHILDSYAVLAGDSFVDVAFTYVRVSDTMYLNLAQMIGCSVHEVSLSLHLHHVKGGTLLTPSAVPPLGTAPPTPAPAITVEPVPAKVPVAAPVVVKEHVSPWLWGASAAIGAALALLVVLCHQRRFRPRALDLVG